jgi:tetratricopeptide (TPR) repeat protein
MSLLKAVFLSTFLLAAITSCSPARGEDALRKAEAYVSERDWERALATVKEFLLTNPHNAGAHLLLGQCYLHMPEPALDVAEGEFKTALFLYEQTGSIGGINVPSQEQFQAIVHTEMAITYLRALYEVIDKPVTGRTLEWLATRSLDHTRRARALYDNAYLKELESTLEHIELKPRQKYVPQQREEGTLTAAPAGLQTLVGGMIVHEHTLEQG